MQVYLTINNLIIIRIIHCKFILMKLRDRIRKAKGKLQLLLENLGIIAKTK